MVSHGFQDPKNTVRTPSGKVLSDDILISEVFILSTRRATLQKMCAC